MSRPLREERPTDGVVLLTLDRPDRRNALSIELRDTLSDALDALAADESVRCVVLTGAGGTFSAGFDLGEFTAAAEVITGSLSLTAVTVMASAWLVLLVPSLAVTCTL